MINFSDPISQIIANVPSMITDFAQQSYDYESGKCKLLWSAPALNGSPIKYYTVTKDVGSGVFYPIYTGTNTFFTDANLIYGQSYNYKVYATNSAGDGP